MIIFRTYSRTENDDFKLNVEPQLSSGSTNYKKEAIELRDAEGQIVGWKIQPQYE